MFFCRGNNSKPHGSREEKLRDRAGRELELELLFPRWFERILDPAEDIEQLTPRHIRFFEALFNYRKMHARLG